MNRSTKDAAKRGPFPYLSTLGAWALAFGCSVGWGAFVMPGTTFLPIAGPIGTAIGIGCGGLVMLILAANYHFLMNRYPDGGGTYTYTKKCFGYDHGFLSAWFLILTYIAIIWANATALPLIARTVLGDVFQFGFDYTVAGFHIYFGEILLAAAGLLIAALLCLHRRSAEMTQILMAVVLFAGVVFCFAAAMGHTSGEEVFSPAFAPNHSAFGGSFLIFALAPWAFVGFESISHSAGEAKFSLKRAFPILAIAVVTAALAYIFLALLAVTALPAGQDDWPAYIAHLESLSGVRSVPTFFAASTALGDGGRLLLGVAALCGIFTGLIGNYIALSRLLRTMSEDGLFPGWLGQLDRNNVPRHAILCILGISVILPFLGRTAISWIVDVTTVGATIAYAFSAACACKVAKLEKNRLAGVTGVAGLVISLLFALVFLIPNLTAIKTLSTESYLILAAWGILGFLFYYSILRKDTHRRLGRSTVAWIVLLGLIIFTSTVWMRQATDTCLEQTIVPLQNYYVERLEEAGTVDPDDDNNSTFAFLRDELAKTTDTIGRESTIQIGLIVAALLLLFQINSTTQRREKQIEVEKALAEESSRAKTSFLSNMSHEIRTPINAIIGLDNIALRDPELSPRTRDQLEKIGASAKHLLGLINDILDMSRIESGRMVLKDEEFSFREFLDQINIIINGQCMDKGLHYECKIVGPISDYYAGDDMKLKQVLINILGNSVKFTDPPGNVTLTVEQTARDESGCTLRFIMKNTGIGMDQAFIPKLFEAFSQEDATSTNRYGGSGLGMAITKSFVEMMDGEIAVESKKGVGSTFTVTVVLKTSDRVFQPEPGVVLPEDLLTLVVDDDEIAGEHAKFVLNTIGIEAVSVTSPHQALQLLQDAYASGLPYRLLLTDYKMPDMNGLDLTRALRAFDNGETTVIMLTGYNWDIIEEEAKAEVDGIIAKPLFSDSLMRTIHSVLERKSGAEPAAVHPAAEASENILAGCRILMAEDVDANAEILADLLELEDILTERAENGQRAVDMFADQPAGYYNAVLMDVRMPIMDGLSATQAIRALDRPDAKEIPIIAMTANVFDEDVERSLQAGMNAHLFKPIEPERLYETLARLITELRAE